MNVIEHPRTLLKSCLSKRGFDSHRPLQVEILCQRRKPDAEYGEHGQGHVDDIPNGFAHTGLQLLRALILESASQHQQELGASTLKARWTCYDNGCHELCKSTRSHGSWPAARPHCWKKDARQSVLLATLVPSGIHTPGATPAFIPHMGFHFLQSLLGHPELF